MLKFVKIGQQTPPKRNVGNRKEEPIKGKVILMKFIKSSLLIKLQNNQVDVLNAEFLFAKFIVH